MGADPLKKKPRVLFLLKYRTAPYDASGAQSWGQDSYSGRPLESGLSNSAKMACAMLQRLGVTAKLTHCIDGDYIHREAVAFEATHVIIEAFWVTPAKFDELKKVLPHVQFIVRNHSETPFLANEGIAFQWMMAYFNQDNVVVAPNSPRMMTEMRYLAHLANPALSTEEVAARVPLLTNYYIVREEPARSLDVEKDVIDIGCFGAIRPLKNQVMQAIAAMRLADKMGKPLAFHINASRVETGGDPVLKSMRSIFNGTRHVLVEHPWLSHDDFLTLMLGMDIVLQVSFSETFNIVAADAVSEGVPVVGSSEIPWLSPLLTADPTNGDDILERLYIAYQMKRLSPAFNPALEGLREYNARTRRHWGDYFGAF